MKMYLSFRRKLTTDCEAVRVDAEITTLTNKALKA